MASSQLDCVWTWFDKCRAELGQRLGFPNSAEDAASQGGEGGNS